MRLKSTFLISLFALSAKSQTYLYNQNGIILSYNCSVIKTFYCNKEKREVYYLKLSWTLSNNSGNLAKIIYGFTVQPNEVSWCTPQGVYDEVAQPVNQPFGTGFGSPVTLRTGDQSFGGYYIWAFSKEYTPGWSISSISFANNTTTSTNNSSIKIQSIPTQNRPTQQLQQPGFSIYQNDNVVNPKQQNDYSQQQKKNDKITNNAMNAWRSSDSVRNDELKRLNSIPNTYKAQTTTQQQQEAIRQRQQQIAAQQQENLIKLQQQFEEQQRRYQQTQLDFANAQTAADNAYQAAIASGKKESGAMVEATLAASQQFTDPNAQLATLGVGLAASLFMHWGEKKQERLEREAALKREEERRQAIINAKDKYIVDALNINKYSFADLVTKQRYAALLLVPKQSTPDKQSIYFTIPVLVPKYADDTYPLKDEIEKKLLKSISLDKPQLANAKVYTLYPITDLEKFQDEFTKKMGSGHLIYLPAELTDFSDYPFNSNTETQGTDFWGNPVKKENKIETNKPTKNDFWSN